MCVVTLRSYANKSTRMVLISIWLISVFTFGPATLMASSFGITREFNSDMLTAVSELYGISEDQAIDRLARETEAAITLKLIKDRSIESYAGSWFDGATSRLKVAIADKKDIEHIEQFDVDPVFVRYSLVELQEQLGSAKSQLRTDRELTNAIVSSYIDYKTNTARLEVDRSDAAYAQFKLAVSEFSESTRIDEVDRLPTISTGPVRGGDGIRNLTWQTEYGGVRPCSVGASVEDGFVTAAHCTEEGDSIGDPSNVSLGTTEGSQYTLGQYNGTFMDVAYVETVSGWTPTAQVNGYSDGNFSVSDEWGGMVEYPVGSTVCRYGDTSGGPHCGTVNQLNMDVVFGYSGYHWEGLVLVPNTNTTEDVTRVTGSCSDPGDSGGTWVAGTGQVQGINVGVDWYDPDNDTCPTTARWTYFQPIKDALDTYEVTMLTAHGSIAPDVTSAECPDSGVSTYGRFYCEVANVDSQGEVELQWTSSNGGSSTKTYLVKRCTVPSTISVTLQATNPYGTDTKYYSFPCPDSN